MERITKHTLFISALLCGAVGALTIGLYLRAMSTGTPEATTTQVAPTAPADMSAMHEEMMKKMPEMHEKMMGEMPDMKEMMAPAEGAAEPTIAAEPLVAPAPGKEELSDEELAAIIDTISTSTGDETVGVAEEVITPAPAPEAGTELSIAPAKEVAGTEEAPLATESEKPVK